MRHPIHLEGFAKHMDFMSDLAAQAFCAKIRQEEPQNVWVPPEGAERGRRLASRFRGETGGAT